MITVDSSVPSLRAAYGMLTRLLLLIRPFWTRLGKGVLAGLLISVLGMTAPLMTKLFIDEALPTHNLSFTSALVLTVACITVVSSVMGALRSTFTQLTTGELGIATSLMFFNHLQHQPVRFFDTHRVGEVMSRFGDVRAALATVARLFEVAIISGPAVLIVPPILIFLNPNLALLSLVALPITTAISLTSGRWQRRYIKQSAVAGAEVGAIQFEGLNNIRTVKLSSSERVLFERVRRETERAFEWQLRGGMLSATVAIVNALARAIGTGLFTWYAWRLLIEGQLTLGGFVAFSAYLGYIVSPMEQIAALFMDFQRSTISLGRMFEYLDSTPEQDPNTIFDPAPPPVRRLAGPVQLRNVNFAYSPGVPALTALTCEFQSHGVTAVVGPSGAGKSTLVRLLARLDEPADGTIRYDGQLASSVSLRDFRSQVTVVWQEVGLLRGTVWDNLTLGISEPHLARVDWAVGICRLTETIGALSDGYATPIAECGATLSGGQRQRIALARALLRATPVLILDEATSNIDAQTEEAILRDLFKESQDKTVICVTHRILSVATADRICVLDRGRLAAFGDHNELLRTSEIYAGLYHSARGRQTPSFVDPDAGVLL